MNRLTLPWHRCKPGESFFVASLQPWLLATAGIKQGKKVLGSAAPIRARVGAYNGALGVLFTVKPTRHSEPPSDIASQ